MDLGLADASVLVAGSSRGIGLAVARGFLAEGARVTITGRDAAALEAARAGLATAFGAERVLAVCGDLTEENDIAAALDATTAAFGPPDAVAANVGGGSGVTGPAPGRLEWDRLLTLNLLGSVRLAEAALARLTARGCGSLTFISSIAGLETLGAPIPYEAAKAGLMAAMKGYARAVGPSGVRVNAVAPGNVLFPGGSWARKLAERPEFFESYIRAETPLQRFGRPEEIADAAVFLASARASFITGSVLVADGGQTRSL